MIADDPIPISALQHYIYCPRQCALIHIEQTYDENLYTLRGSRVHERVDSLEHEWIAGVRIERALPLYSSKLGLTGRADVVEFSDEGTPHPVEYKAGTRGRKEADDVQLCAQGMCLEEMFDVTVGEGSLYYDRSRRRRVVTFDAALREQVARTTEAARQLFHDDKLPAPVADSRCSKCSLFDACMPFALSDFELQDLFKVKGS